MNLKKIEKEWTSAPIKSAESELEKRNKVLHLFELSLLS